VEGVTAAARPALGPAYQAVLLVRPEAWPAFARWLPMSGLATTRVPAADAVPRFDLAAVPAQYRRDLSVREIDVLELIAEGLQNGEIATRLFISVETVRVHSKHIYRKLAARSRAHAVHIGYQRGILGGA
jgi:DNA-binding CsgD family transcriptional regulator